MARYAYDVNTRTRLIDVHKQFNRGLKTVDTDDALGSVFLRQAENVSLSEFGFIEKRYGTIKKETIKQTNGTLQGFWEFGGFSIYAVNNIFYYNNGTTETAITSIAQENSDYRYPTLPTYNSSGFGTETTYRDMGAVNINNVLYIFTGYYPVYVKIVNSVPTFYWFSVTVPTYDEIVVTGHNLLEDNYEEAYGYTGTRLKQTGTDIFGNAADFFQDNIEKTWDWIHILKDNDDKFLKSHYPSIPFADNEGKINFSFNYELTPSLNQNAFAEVDFREYHSIELAELSYRTSGAGASNLGFNLVDLENTNWTNKTNSQSTVYIPKILPLIEEVALGTELKETDRQQLPNQVYTKKIKTSDLIDAELFLSNDDYYFLFSIDDPNGGVGDPKLPIAFDSQANFLTPFNLSHGGSATAFVNNFTRVRIVPVDADGREFDVDKVVLTGSDLDLNQTSKQYRFEVPRVLKKLTGVSQFKIDFRTEVEFRHTTPVKSDLEDIPEIYKTLQGLVKVAGSASDDYILGTEPPKLDFHLNDLIPGTYDFKVVFELHELQYRNGKLDFQGPGNGIYPYEVYFYNVPITAEKLQDFPGQDTDFLPKLKPIWSCNKVIEHYGKLMVWGSEDETNGMPTAVFYSFPDRPTYFPAKFYLDFSNDANEKIEAVTPYMNILIAQTASQTWGIRGNSGLLNAPAPYTPFGVNPTVGTIAYKSVRPVRNQLFFLSKQGIVALTSLYAVDESYNIKFVDRNIRNIVPQDSKAVGIQFDNQYWLNFPNNSITLRWYIDKKAWVKDVYQGFASEGFKGVFKYQIVGGKLEFITHPSETSDVNNLTIYRLGIDDTIPTDLFSPISAKFETSFLNQNYPFHPKNYKEAKLDFTLQNEYNLGRDAFYDSTRDTDFTIQGGGGASAFQITVPAAFSKNHRYRIEFTPDTGSTVTHIPLTAITIEGQSSYSSDLTAIGTATNTLIWEFNITNDYNQDANSLDILANLSSEDANAIASVVIRDVTYDSTLAFSTYVISEDKTLNFDNSPGYNQATVDVDLDLTLKGRLGDWTFGESDFGDKVTAVKTIKLSGKGYNAKVYVEDVSKSKWTLESLGLTYKMKRARSR